MTKNFEHVSHIKSKLPKENIIHEEFYGLKPKVDNSDVEGSSPIKIKFPKLPTKDKLIEGEIAVNYLKGHETLSIKNSENKIVGFVNENEFFQAQEIISSALGQEKNDRIESISKLEEKIDKLNDISDENTKTIEDNELVISSSLNDLNTRIEELSNNSETQTEEINVKFNEVNQRIDDNELAISTALNDLNTRIIKHNSETYTKQEVNDLSSNFFDGVRYDSDNKEIIFRNGLNIIATIDVTDFIKDGMVSDVAISNDNLVITFNTDAGHNDISIPLTDIFNPANYYNKTEVDDKLALKADASNVYTKAEADGKFITEHQSLADYPTIETMNTALGQKANTADLATVATSGSYNDLTDRPTNVSTFTNDAGYLTEHQSLENYYTKSEVDNVELVVSSSLNDLNSRIEDLKNTQIANVETNIQTLRNNMEDDELVISSSLNDLNSRIETNFSSIKSLLDKIDELTQRVTVLENTSTSEG